MPQAGPGRPAQAASCGSIRLTSFLACPFRLLPLITLVSLVLSGCDRPPAKPEVIPRGDYAYAKRYISWLVEKGMKKHKVKGLSIALVDDQRVVWAEGFGYADEDRGIPATPDTVYPVGSISKVFTATAAMQLAEQGKLDIDAPLERYLPEFSMKTRYSDAPPITPRNIMTHHSGLPANYWKGMWTYDPADPVELLEPLKEEYTAFPPDQVYAYSNLALSLLGIAVERVSGRAFATHMDESVLEPLGMAHSAFVRTFDCEERPEIRRRLSKLYLRGKAYRHPACRDMAAATLVSSVLDLSRFVQMVFAGGKAGGRVLLKPGTLAEMLRPQNTDVPLDLDHRIGLGWHLQTEDAGNAGILAGHGGGTYAFQAWLLIAPEHKLGVTVLSNSSTSRRIVFDVTRETLYAALEAKRGIQQPPEPTQPPIAPVSEQVLGAFEGSYMVQGIGLATIDRKGKHLRVRARGNTLDMVPRAGDRFSLEHRILGLIPTSLGKLDHILLSRRDVLGHEILVGTERGEDGLAGEKVQPRPIPATWSRQLGELEVVNPDDFSSLLADLRVGEEQGFMFLSYQVPALKQGETRVWFTPLSDAEAVVPGLGTGLGETIRLLGVGGEERLRYSGYVFRKRESN